MKRVGSLLVRAIVLALLLLTIGGGIANVAFADTISNVPPVSLPDDPGYGP